MNEQTDDWKSTLFKDTLTYHYWSFSIFFWALLEWWTDIKIPFWNLYSAQIIFVPRSGSTCTISMLSGMFSFTFSNKWGVFYTRKKAVIQSDCIPSKLLDSYVIKLSIFFSTTNIHTNYLGGLSKTSQRRIHIILFLLWWLYYNAMPPWYNVENMPIIIV